MALKTQFEVEQVADSLTKSADTIRKQLIKEIKKGSVDQAKARLLFQDEAVLRQKANGLYIDAANCVLKSLPGAEDEVVKVISAANEKMKKIDDLERFIDLVADLLVLAAAVYAAKPGPLLAALGEVRNDLKE
jgi:hypothetical protein